MGPDAFNDDDLRAVRDLGVQSVAVPLEVKNDPVVGQETRPRIPRLDIGRCAPCGAQGFAQPSIDSGSGVTVCCDESLQFHPPDDAHAIRAPVIPSRDLH